MLTRVVFLERAFLTCWRGLKKTAGRIIRRLGNREMTDDEIFHVIDVRETRLP